MSWHTIQSWSTTMALVEALRRQDGELIFGLGAMVANTARSFTELRARAGTEEARAGQRLIIGPWDHLNSTGVYPEHPSRLILPVIRR